MTTKEDINEIKADVKEMKGMLQEALVQRAIIEQRLNSVAGKVNSMIAFTLAAASGLAYAAWDYIKHKIGIN